MSVKPLRRVLLVDDDRVTNLMHTRIISRTGLAEDVEVATDGQAALEYLQNEPGDPPELILLDINMPRMNGFEFLEAYAGLPEKVIAGQKIIMLSTSTLENEKNRATADPNVHSFMSKPLNSDFLRAFVREVSRGTGAG